MRPAHRSLPTACLLAAAACLVLACGERARRTGEQPAPPLDTTAVDSAAVIAPSTTSVVTPTPTPGVVVFPTDRDTTRFATQLTRPSETVPQCAGGAPTIRGDSIGPFRLDEPLSELTQRCPHLLYGWVLISDGYPVPTVAVRMGGATITAYASDSLSTATLTRVEVGGPGLRTAEGLGVGSTLGALQGAYGAPLASESDCVLRVWFDTRPGLAFVMAYPAAKPRECGALSEPPLPAELRVTSVLLVPR
jgi:hypothetical protein